MRSVHIALSYLPERLSLRAAAAIPMIVVLPSNKIGIDGASFDLTRAVLVFEREGSDEEIMTTLHEIAHVLDPGWQEGWLGHALKQDLPKVSRETKRLLHRVGTGAFEGFAELAAWEMAGMKQLDSFSHSRAIVHQALYWEN